MTSKQKWDILAFLENMKFKENISPQNSKIQITSQFSQSPGPPQSRTSFYAMTTRHDERWQYANGLH